MNTVISPVTPQLASQQDGFMEFALSRLSNKESFRTFQSNQIEAFRLRGFPSRKDEKWKYTDLSVLSRKLDANQLALPIKKDYFSDLPTSPLESIHLVFIDGYFSASLSNLKMLPSKAIACSTREMLNIDEKRILPLLTECFDANRFPMACLNGAGMTEGLYVNIPQNVFLNYPIRCTYIQTQEDVILSPRNIVVVGENSSVTIIEEYKGEANSYVTNAVTRIVAAHTAKIHYFKLQQEASQATHFSSVFISQNENSSVNSFSLSCGSRLAREEIQVSAKEKQANCHLRGVYLLGEDLQQSDHYLHVDHSASFCSSSMKYKGLLNKKSRAVFNGKVFVQKDAKHISAHQENHNLLLSSNAEINTKPELEIYADDVKCTHGATVGQLDNDALFYFRSRGIEETQAKMMLQEAFVMDFFEAIKDPSIKTYLLQQVAHDTA